MRPNGNWSGPSNWFGSIPKNIQGIMLALLSGLIVAVGAGLGKHVTNQLPAFEVVFFRNFFGVVVMLPWLF